MLLFSVDIDLTWLLRFQNINKMEDGAIFPHKEILHFINENLELKQFTMQVKTPLLCMQNVIFVPLQDLKNPTASFVQMVYIRFLQDFGFNTSSMLVPSMELMDSLDHPEVPATTCFGLVS